MYTTLEVHNYLHPCNETARISKLASFDFDYSSLHNTLNAFTKLAAKIGGTEISLINLIDNYTQWSVSNHGLLLQQMPREDSVCQYTIAGKDHFEVENLKEDKRFCNKFYVAGGLKLRYYFGVPLTTNEGYNIGALCLLDKQTKVIAPEKKEMLKLIAEQIVNRLELHAYVQQLQQRLHKSEHAARKAAHDIRGPLNGIVGLSKYIMDTRDINPLDEIIQYVSLIHKSGNSTLELAEEILGTDSKLTSNSQGMSAGRQQINLQMLRDKLDKLYRPQALHKEIDLNFSISEATKEILFARKKLLQIAGNLISNAIKFTPQQGTVTVKLQLIKEKKQNKLNICIADTGKGLSSHNIQQIQEGTTASTQGTAGETGYGLGLTMVTQMIQSLNGSLDITSVPGEGTTFDIWIPNM